MSNSLTRVGISVVVHLAILSVLYLYVVPGKHKATQVRVLSELNEEVVPQDFPDELPPDEAIDMEQSTSLTPSSTNSGASSAVAAAGVPSAGNSAAAAQTAALSDRSLSRPLTGGMQGMNLDSVVTGIKGTAAMADGGDEGTIERIVQEVVRFLDKKKVLVVWVFDSSGSLAERREDIAKRFDRIYKEFSDLKVLDNEAILTSIAAVGKETTFLLDKPSNDLEEIRKAIRAVKDDETGLENMMTAVREVATKYRKFQTAQRRQLLVVLVTDEIGDDLAESDATTQLLVRNEVPLYVMGPMATFGRNVIHDHEVDENGQSYWVPINRGPHTRDQEVVMVPFHHDYYTSGFGPFGLTQMTRETGGLFFVYHDTTRFDPTKFKFDLNAMMLYRPSYEPANTYYQEAAKTPWRADLTAMVKATNDMYHPGFPDHWVHWDRHKEEIEARTKEMAKFVEFCKQAVPRLEKMDKERTSESDQKWRANFDLAYARILQAKVRGEEFMWALQDFKVNPRTLAKTPPDWPKKENNGWHMEWHKDLSIGFEPGMDPKDRPKAGEKPKAVRSGGFGDPKIAEQNRAYLATAKALYKRTIDEHPGTPWFYAASHEQNFDRYAGVKGWKEGFDGRYIPPEYVKKMPPVNRKKK